MSPEEQIIQQQVDIEGSKHFSQVKVPELDESFGFKAKAKFCEMWKKALTIVSDEDNLMSYFVKVTGRPKVQLQAALENEEKWKSQLRSSGLESSGFRSREEAQLHSI